MRTLLPLLLLAALFYTGWFYWQQYANRPLREPLLPWAISDISRVSVHPPNQQVPFSLHRIEDRWVVARANRQLFDQTVRAERLVRLLTQLTSDSVSFHRPAAAGWRIRLVTADEQTDEIVLYPATAVGPLVSISATGDCYHLANSQRDSLLPRLRFDYFRERRLLNLSPAAVDSIVAMHHDSLLWTTDSINLAPLLHHFLAPATAPHADYFDEIAHRDRYYADLDFYSHGQPRRIQVFHDSLWPLPYVLIGEDYPRRFLGFREIQVAPAF